MKEISGLIFDFGCVITLPQNEKAVARMLERLNAAGRDGNLPPIGRDAFLASYNRHRDAYDKGIASQRQYWLNVLDELGVRISGELVEELSELDIDCWFHYDGEMLDYIAAQKKEGTKLALLSNINFEGSAWLRKTADWIKYFDVLVLSAEELLLKPEPAIYELCLKKLCLPAGSCLFVDDRQPNIDGARRVGLNGHLYRGLEGLKKDIAENYRIVHQGVRNGANAPYAGGRS